MSVIFEKAAPPPLPVKNVLYLLQYLNVNVLYIVVRVRQKGHRRKGAQEERGTRKMGTGKQGTNEKLGKKGTNNKKCVYL